ncbi:hypothetical protein [Streptomyces sp. NPDC002132]
MIFFGSEEWAELLPEHMVRASELLTEHEVELLRRSLLEWASSVQ